MNISRRSFFGRLAAAIAAAPVIASVAPQQVAGTRLLRGISGVSVAGLSPGVATLAGTVGTSELPHAHNVASFAEQGLATMNAITPQDPATAANAPSSSEPNEVRVTAADYNGATFDGRPFSAVPAWLEDAIGAGNVMLHQGGGTDYAVWEVLMPDATIMKAGPGDYITRTETIGPDGKPCYVLGVRKADQTPSKAAAIIETPPAHKPGIRIVNTEGEPNRTKILCAVTSADIGRMVPISGVTIRNTLGRITASLEIDTVSTDVVPEKADWLVRHPVSGRLEPLAAMRFVDGTWITFEAGNPKVAPGAPPEKVTLLLNLDVKGMLHRAAAEMFGADVPLPPEDATAEEMVNAIAFHLRLRAAVTPESAVAAFARPINADGSPQEVPPADFWTVLRPASVVGGPVSLGEPDAWVYVGESNGRFFTYFGRGYDSPDGHAAFDHIDAAIKDATDRAQGVNLRRIDPAPVPPLRTWVLIERFGDHYLASTNPDPQTGAATGLTAGPLDGALAFARFYLTRRPDNSVVTTEAA